MLEPELPKLNSQSSLWVQFNSDLETLPTYRVQLNCERSILKKYVISTYDIDTTKFSVRCKELTELGENSFEVKVITKRHKSPITALRCNLRKYLKHPNSASDETLRTLTYLIEQVKANTYSRKDRSVSSPTPEPSASLKTEAASITGSHTS